MSEQKRRPDAEKPRRIKLPDGSWAVYMGETGKNQVRDKGRRTSGTLSGDNSSSDARHRVGNTPAPEHHSSGSSDARYRAGNTPAPEHHTTGSTARQSGRYKGGIAIPETERREIERRRRAEYEARVRRAAAKGRGVARPGESRKFYKVIFDRVYMWWMAISIDVAQILRGAVVAALILIFAMLQTTVFTSFRLFGAVPDLMLSLVIAIGVTEGDRWGGICGLICAVIIESIGGNGLSLLPLLYVPAGYIAGILGTFYFRDSIPVRAIYSAGAGVLRAVVTVICTVGTYGKIDAGLMLSTIVIPEYFSSLIMSVIPHAAAYLALKPFHKSRAERVN